MRILNNINYHLTKHRSAYLIFVLAFLFLSLAAFFGLRLFFEHDCDRTFFAVWSVLSILIGSLVFFQLNESSLYNDLEGVIKELNRMMRQIRDDHNLNELYVITPNLNIGQTKCPKQFKVFQRKIKELVNNQKSIYISVWGLEQELFIFDMNEEEIHVRTISNPSSFPLNPDSFPHMNYVAELLKKAPKVKDGEENENNDKINTLMRDYNLFIKTLNNYNNLKIYATDNPTIMSGRFFVVYNGKKLFYSTIKNDGRMSTELIKEEEFINTVWPSLREKYFDQTKCIFCKSNQ